MRRIRYIFTDWFEVFSNGIYGKGEMGRLVEKVGLTREEYMKKDGEVNWALLQELNRGNITERTYWKRVIARTGWNVTPEQMIELTDEVVKIPIPGTAEIAKDLHAMGYKFILISDLCPKTKSRILLNYPWITQLYERTFFSCDYGKLKSDPDYFNFILEQTGINPEEAFFFDDYDVNVDTAKSVGINGVVFENAIQLEKAMRAAGLYDQSPCA